MQLAIRGVAFRISILARKLQRNAKYIFSLKHVKMYTSMSGAGTESDTAVPTGVAMRSGIRKYFTQKSLALLMLCTSLLFMLCVRPTPVYAEEMSEAKTVRVG